MSAGDANLELNLLASLSLDEIVYLDGRVVICI